MKAEDFDFPLPPDLIAQVPPPERGRSRLLVLDRRGGALEHRSFADFPSFLRAGDTLVLNDSRVLPARLRARNLVSTGKFEILLLEEKSANQWDTLLKPGRRAPEGAAMEILDRDGRPSGFTATVTAVAEDGGRRLRFDGPGNILQRLDALGEIPLPPYIHRDAPLASDRDRYQTVYARDGGSVAAPTAGLHFTESMLDTISGLGVAVRRVTLHVGAGTFSPVKSDTVEAHVMHEERYSVPAETAETVNQTRPGGRVIAVGTTSLRVLESAADAEGKIRAGAGRTRLFIYPPRSFAVVGALLTNFHLPRSTLLMLAAAFAAPGETSGREKILAAYADAAARHYRFFSYGDAMLIL